MKVDTLGLAWIVVKDLKQAVKFYTDVIGLKLMEMHEEFGWAELQGHHGGAILGIAQAKSEEQWAAGDNACVTFTVANLDEAKNNAVKKGAKCVGDVIEVPGHVRMQMVRDADGNQFQLVQKLF